MRQVSHSRRNLKGAGGEQRPGLGPGPPGALTLGPTSLPRPDVTRLRGHAPASVTVPGPSPPPGARHRASAATWGRLELVSQDTPRRHWARTACPRPMDGRCARVTVSPAAAHQHPRNQECRCEPAPTCTSHTHSECNRDAGWRASGTHNAGAALPFTLLRHEAAARVAKHADCATRNTSQWKRIAQGRTALASDAHGSVCI